MVRTVLLCLLIAVSAFGLLIAFLTWRGAAPSYAQTPRPKPPAPIGPPGPSGPAGTPAPTGASGSAADAILNQIPIAAPSAQNPSQITRQIFHSPNGLTWQITTIPKSNPQHDSLLAQLSALAHPTASAECPNDTTDFSDAALIAEMDGARTPTRTTDLFTPTVEGVEGEFQDGVYMGCAAGWEAFDITDEVFGIGTGQYVYYQNGQYGEQDEDDFCFDDSGCSTLWQGNYDFNPSQSIEAFNIYWTGPAIVYDYWCSELL